MYESMGSYLSRVHRAPLPRWLEEGDFSLNRFFESRTVYYPGAGGDGSPLKLFNVSHAAHSFVWADQNYNFDDMRAAGDLDLRGYNVLHIDYTGILIKTNYGPAVDNPSCHMVIYERKSHLGDDHGAERLALLVIRAEAHSTYENLYGARFRRHPPFAVVIQDHGFGGNFTGHKFGGSNAPIFHTAQFNGLPRFLLCGIGHGGTEVWPRYVRVDNIRPTFGGTVGMSRHGTTKRWLYHRQAGQ